MYFKSLMIYTTLNGLTPSYISDMFTAVSDVHNRNTRSATAGQLALPFYRSLLMVQIPSVLMV